MTTGKTIPLIRQTFAGKVVSLLFNMLSRFAIAFLPRSRCLLISWLQSPSAVILEPNKIKSLTAFNVLQIPTRSPSNMDGSKTCHSQVSGMTLGSGHGKLAGSSRLCKVA